jgi:NADH:ubiquinone oxidoreductase subunit 2 (subunit N)
LYFFFSYLVFYFFFFLVLLFARKGSLDTLQYNIDLALLVKYSANLVFFLILIFFSLSGLPPFLFFYAKYNFFTSFMTFSLTFRFFFFLFCFFTMSTGTFIYFRYLKIILSEISLIFTTSLFSNKFFYFLIFCCFFPFFTFFFCLFIFFFKRI